MSADLYRASQEEAYEDTPNPGFYTWPSKLAAAVGAFGSQAQKDREREFAARQKERFTTQDLKEIIQEETILALKEALLVERLATVPQVQQMAAAAGVRLSYGDAKTLAAQTQAERGALQALQKALQNGTWKRMIR